jgi:hypothetical protein
MSFRLQKLSCISCRCFSASAHPKISFGLLKNIIFIKINYKDLIRKILNDLNKETRSQTLFAVLANATESQRKRNTLKRIKFLLYFIYQINFQKAQNIIVSFFASIIFLLKYNQIHYEPWFVQLYLAGNQLRLTNFLLKVPLICVRLRAWKIFISLIFL